MPQTAHPNAITLLNSPVLTDYGSYRYRPVSLREARLLVRVHRWQSAIGHQSTAAVISELLGIPCPANRITFRQKAGEDALVLTLAQRPPEGVVLSRMQIESIGYAWALITRLQ